MSAEDDILKVLSVSGGMTIFMTSDGGWQANVRMRSSSVWHVKFADDPIEALSLAAASVRPEDVKVDYIEVARKHREKREKQAKAIETSYRDKSRNNDDLI